MSVSVLLHNKTILISSMSICRKKYPSPSNFINKETQEKVFSCEFCDCLHWELIHPVKFNPRLNAISKIQFFIGEYKILPGNCWEYS